ncbi:MAG: hypothetical protein H0W15_13015 [Gemmatimonadales bacterium]|nr:hypothetical protein [Gemmatimonadales bacterium]
MLMALAVQAPRVQDAMVRIEVNDVIVIAEPRHANLGTALADIAASPREWLGLGRVDVGPLTLAIVPDRAAFARAAQGRIPEWGAGFTFPEARMIVIRADAGDPRGTLRHELAHLVLHRRVASRVPRWFNEGYAVLAAGEYGRLDALHLNLTVVSGRVPDLRGVDGALRGGTAADAETAYALAASAVAELARRNPTRTLRPLLDRLSAGESFDDAVLATTGFTADGFDETWHRSIRRRYNWGIWLLTGGVWVVVAVGLGAGAAWRRRYDAPRRAALDQGWPEPPDGVTEDDNLITLAGDPLDHSDTDR